MTTEAEKKYNREYARLWRAKNITRARELSREGARRYYAKNSAAVLAKSKTVRDAKNIEKYGFIPNPGFLDRRHSQATRELLSYSMNVYWASKRSQKHRKKLSKALFLFNKAQSIIKGTIK